MPYDVMNDAIKDEGMSKDMHQKSRHEAEAEDETSAAGNETTPKNDSKSNA